MSSSEQGHCYRYTFLSRCVVLYCPAIENALIENLCSWKRAHFEVQSSPFIF